MESQGHKALAQGQGDLFAPAASALEAYASGGLGELEASCDSAPPSGSEAASIARAALAAGDMATIAWLAERLGGMEALEALAPDLVERALLDGDEDSAIWLLSKGFWAKRPTRSRELPKRAETLRRVPENDLSVPVALGALAFLAILVKKSEWAQAEILRADSDGRTLLWEARDAESSRFLLGQNLDASARSASGETAALSALRRASESEGAEREARAQAAAEMARALRGADPKTLSEALEAALPFPEAIEALVAAGADPKAPLGEPSFDPPAARAAKMGYPDSAEALVRLGADARAPNRDGESAVDILAASGHGEAAERILQAEADREARERAAARSRQRDETQGKERG